MLPRETLTPEKSKVDPKRRQLAKHKTSFEDWVAKIQKNILDEQILTAYSKISTLNS